MPVFCETNTFDAGFWVAVFSGLVSFFSFVLALDVSLREKNHYFETNVESCYSPISAFIYDSFWLISESKFKGYEKLREAEDLLIEGIHKLNTFAITNKYKVLKDIVPIRKDGAKKPETFSYYLLLLEDKYINFRAKHTRGKVKQDQIEGLVEMNLCFRDLLILLGKYNFTLKGKHFRWAQKRFIDEAKKIWERAEACNLK